MSVVLPPGSMSLDERLHRLETNDREILQKLETLAKATDVESLRSRLEMIERTYVSKGSVWAFIVFITIQFLVIIGLGLGLVYEVLKK